MNEVLHHLSKGQCTARVTQIKIRHQNKNPQILLPRCFIGSLRTTVSRERYYMLSWVCIRLYAFVFI